MKTITVEYDVETKKCTVLVDGVAQEGVTQVGFEQKWWDDDDKDKFYATIRKTNDDIETTTFVRAEEIETVEQPKRTVRQALSKVLVKESV